MLKEILAALSLEGKTIRQENQNRKLPSQQIVNKNATDAFQSHVLSGDMF